MKNALLYLFGVVVFTAGLASYVHAVIDKAPPAVIGLFSVAATAGVALIARSMRERW